LEDEMQKKTEKKKEVKWGRRIRKVKRNENLVTEIARLVKN